jgi:hypothetical protein
LIFERFYDLLELNHGTMLTIFLLESQNRSTTAARPTSTGEEHRRIG